MGEMAMGGAMGGAMRSGSAPSSFAMWIPMWVAMMAAMMLPSLAPTLWRYRLAFARSDGAGAASLTALVGTGYFAVWIALGVVAYPLSIALAVLARSIPMAAGTLVIAGGALQLSSWKAHHLDCCRSEPSGCSTVRANATTAWQRGVRLGIECCYCCVGLSAAALVIGDMGLRMTALMTAAITIERLAPAGARVARVIGVVVVCAGVYMMARAAGLG